MKDQLQKRYGLPMAIAMVVGIVIGSGVFFKAETVLKATGGDVLTGILASLVSQGMEPFDAAVCAAYLHGAAADRCVQRLSEYYMQPDDILKDLGELLKEHIR